MGLRLRHTFWGGTLCYYHCVCVKYLCMEKYLDLTRPLKDNCIIKRDNILRHLLGPQIVLSDDICIFFYSSQSSSSSIYEWENWALGEAHFFLISQPGKWQSLYSKLGFCNSKILALNIHASAMCRNLLGIVETSPSLKLHLQRFWFCKSWVRVTIYLENNCIM